MAQSRARTAVFAVMAAATLAGAGYIVYQRTSAPTGPSPEQIAIDAAIDAALKEPASARPAPSPEAAPVSATPPEPQRPPTTLEQLVSQTMPAVVRVETADGFGSGFFIKTDMLLTNAHVVGRATTVNVRLQNNAVLFARVDTAAPELDIAILRVEKPRDTQPILILGSGQSARPGQEVVVLGTPMGLQNTVTRGIVSAVRQIGPVTLVQTDAAVNPGNSGGPVLDRDGSVIGIATMAAKAGVAQGLSFAVAIDHATALIAGERPLGAAPTPLAGLTEAMTGPTPAPAAPSLEAPRGASESDLRRANGARVFEQTIAEVARSADQLDAHWAQFVRGCYRGDIAGGFARNWFAVFESSAMKGAVGPGCGGAFENLQATARDVRDKVLAAEEAARRADVYPGARREVLQKHRLDYAGWAR